MNYIRTYWAGFVMQWHLLSAVPAAFVGAVIISPLVISIFFFFFLDVTGRLSDLGAYALVAPTLAAMWQGALFLSGATISLERGEGTLEALMITPNSGFALSILGRVTLITLSSLVGLFESLIVGLLLFRTPLVIEQPFAFAIIMTLTIASVVTMSLIVTSTFVLARAVQLLQNLLSTPIFLLSGIAFPIELLPGWLRPLSKVIPLSWSADGLRHTFGQEPIEWLTYIMLICLTLAYGAVGLSLLSWVERRVRLTGKVSLS